MEESFRQEESAGLVSLFGSQERVSPARNVKLGALTFQLTHDALRQICWHGVELVRAVTWPIRDPNWVTLIPKIHDEAFEQVDGGIDYSLTFSVADGKLVCRLSVTAGQDGHLSLQLEMEAIETFSTNRAGFTVLHPIAGVAGTQVTVAHSDGSKEQAAFPELISPGQPIFDIIGLRHTVQNAHADIRFEGEVFEMEDQRNWSDASFKTYCVPLALPFTYEIIPGEKRSQTIHIALYGETTADPSIGAEVLTVEPTGMRIPEIGLALEPGWLGPENSRDLISEIGAGYLSMRTSTSSDKQFLSDVARICSNSGAQLDVEVVIPDDTDPLTGLTSLAKDFSEFDLRPERVLALRQCYLASYQPSGPWPKGPTPSAVANAVRAVFPNCRVGGGMLTNFTELNRCRPDPENCDFISHGNTAIVHAADDLSVRETLEALPQIMKSAQTIGSSKPYRLGLMSVGMRSNPYGADVATNPAQVRQPMAREDPRQRGLFGAAYAVGVLAAAADCGVEALCPAAPFGPMGAIYERQTHAQPYFDETSGAAVYPIFHVIKAAARLAGKEHLTLANLPLGLHGFGARMADADHVILANVSPEMVPIDLKRSGTCHLLDRSTFEHATMDSAWLGQLGNATDGKLKLDPYAVAFIEMPGGAQ